MEIGISGRGDTMLIIVGGNKKQIQKYIKHQLEENQIADQMSLKEFVDSFTGKNTKAQESPLRGSP